jgi:glycosyltransferase involved in cell wall biosynthesis
MPDLRVGYIVPSLDDTTGWGRWANDFLRHIEKEGVAPVVFAPPSSSRHIPNADGQMRFVLPELFDYLQSSTGLRRLPAIARFRRGLAADARVDLVHSFDAHPWGLYGDWLARAHGVPHLLTTHGRYGYIAQNRWVDRQAYSGVLRRAAAMVAVSEAVRRAVCAAFPGVVAPSKVSVLQNPVDEAQFREVGALPAEVPPTGSVIVSVTRFVPVKDIETAVRAFALVKQRHADASYWIIGPGNGPNNPYFRQIQHLIEAERIADVHIVGRLPKDVLTAFYRRAALLLHTARTLADDFEASGLILLEAGLLDLPVVATASGGIPEVVTHDVTGLMAPERDHTAVAAAVCRLLEDNDTRRRLGAANRERARQRHWKGYAASHGAMYRKLTIGQEG